MRTAWIAAIVGVVLAPGVPATASPPRAKLESSTASSLAGVGALSRTGTLDERSVRRIASIPWRARRYETAHGDRVTVEVSPSYADDPATAQRWADFFATLVHGPELALLAAYVAPLEEVRSICRGPDVLGCYGADKLVFVGDSSGGFSPASIALHEYGHHVAYNRLNPPWIALDWGTKRWASAMNVCSRVSSRTAYPGAEDVSYPLNPGEAFAESYRVLNEMQPNTPQTWPIVDYSFRPDAAALEALRDDVVNPWTRPTAQTIHGRFAPGRHTWRRRIATPLDGTVSIELSPGSNDLRLLSNDERTVLARSTWTQAGAKSITYIVCGRRSLTLSVVGSGRSGAFTVRLSRP